jgi:predicted esterase
MIANTFPNGHDAVPPGVQRGSTFCDYRNASLRSIAWPCGCDFSCLLAPGSNDLLTDVQQNRVLLSVSLAIAALGCGSSLDPHVAEVSTGGSGSATSESPPTPSAATPSPPTPSPDGGPDDQDACAHGQLTATNTARPLGTTGAQNGYWEYLPAGYGDGTRRPLLVFLHGGGETGLGSSADLEKVNAHGPPKLIAVDAWPATRPFIVLSPQHGLSGCSTAAETHDFIEFALGEYDTDPERVYLTGLSCGASGAADYLGRYGGEQVAAAVLISGDANMIWPAQGCGLLNHLGLWAFHGDADGNVAGDDTAMPRFIGCPSPHRDVRYTLYPGVGHDAWTMTYDLSAGHDIYAWMLESRR